MQKEKEEGAQITRMFEKAKKNHIICIYLKLHINLCTHTYVDTYLNEDMTYGVIILPPRAIDYLTTTKLMGNLLQSCWPRESKRLWNNIGC